MSKRSPSQVSAARVAMLLGALVAFSVLGSSAVAVALPAMAADLRLNTAGAAWVLAAYALTFAVTTAVFGRLADLRGLRLPMRIGIALFVAGSLLAAGSWSFPSLIAGRLIQGAGAGAVPVLSAGVVAARYDEGTRGRVLGWLTVVVTLVSGSGPLLGGVITTALGWRAVLGLPALMLAVAEPATRTAPVARRTPGRLDLVGVALTALGIGGLVLLLQAPGTGLGWPTIVAIAAVTAGAAVALTQHVRRHPEGFVPRALVANRPLLLAATSGLALLAAYIGLVLAVPLLLAARGWSPLRIGLILLPAAACGAVASRLIGGVVTRHRSTRSHYAAVSVLAMASTAGLLVAGLGASVSALLVLGLALAAAGFGGGQVALVDLVPDLVEPHVRGVALGLFNLVFFTGGAIGAATVGGLADVVGLAPALLVVAALPLVAALRTRPAARRA